MAWYNENGKRQDVVISTRVRLARNVSDIPFTSKMSDKDADTLINKVSAALPSYSARRFSDRGNTSCRSYMEMHYVSPEFVSSDIHRALLSGERDRIQIMVCEEDHIRLQAIVAGFEPEKATELVGRADDALSRALPIAFSERYGYLTACPTNLGAAMRLSVMLCLPALTMSHAMGRYISAAEKLGVTVRGIYGEGSRASGCLYQISNRGSLGIGESDIIKLVSEVTEKLCEAEGEARKAIFDMNPVTLIDKTARTVGILKNAHTLASSELLDSFSELKLGLSLGILNGIEDKKLSELLVATQPATMSMLRQGLEDERERDIARASLVRDMLASVTVEHGKKQM